MGDIFHGLFGGSQSSSESQSQSQSHSGNYAYPYIQDTFSPVAGQGAGSAGEYAGLLGLGGGDPQAFQKYLNSSGYNFLLDSGSKAITNNAAARGLLNSGSTLKALQTFGQNLASTKEDEYLGHLSDLAKLALGAGGLISNSGQYSDSSSSSSSSSSEDKETGGFGKFLGKLMACARELKKDVERIGTLPDGLPIYAFDYIGGHGLPEGRQIGPMADEVAEYQPWALGPEIDGYQTIIPALLNVEPDPAQVARFL